MENYCLVSGSYYSGNPYNRFTRLWQASEAYLDVGQKKYRVSDLGRLELSEEHSSDSKFEVALKVLKIATYVLFPLALGALAIRTYYRSKWRVSEHISLYKSITYFPLTPPGKPIPSLQTLLDERKPKPQPQQQTQPQPQSQPQPPRPAFDTIEFPPIVLPVSQPNPEPPPSQVVLGIQTVGNDAVRVLDRNTDVDIATNTIVTMADGTQYRYIRGNNNKDILIRM